MVSKRIVSKGIPANEGAGKTALITGASSGIGEAIAARLAQAGYNLVLVARSADKLKALAKELSEQYQVKVWSAPADLFDREAPAKLLAAMKRARRPIDFLVNCAGVLEHADFVGMSPARHHQMIDLNISSLTSMLALFVQPMVERGSGRVLNVASIAAFQPIPKLATYAATKAYVLSLTESLSEELKGTGVSMTALCPGLTATSMLSGAKQSNSQLNKLPNFLVASAESVANEGYEACVRGEVIRVPGAVNLAATLAGRATPKWLLRSISGALVRSLK